LRGETRSFILWADGICTNQNDGKEKVVQIQLTGLIYAEASNTIVYLGLGNPNGKETQCSLMIRDGRKPAGVDTLFSICQKEWFARVVRKSMGIPKIGVCFESLGAVGRSQGEVGCVFGKGV
jgi:hypothetical protein